MLRFSAIIALLFTAAGTASAEVVGVEVHSRADVLNGRAFGSAGPYEKISGTLRFAVDPENAANQRISDIEYGPTNADGRVEFASDFYLLKPKAIERGNGSLLIDIANRGNKIALSIFHRGAGRAQDPTTAEEFGDGFLMQEGYAVLWVGWQFDVPKSRADLMHLDVPVATDDGEPITGLVRNGYTVNRPTQVLRLGERNHDPYPVRDPADPDNVLYVRDAPGAPPRVVPKDQWRFARIESGEPIADNEYLYVESGFEPGKVYEIVYEVADPALVGLGLAVVRDAASYIKHEGSAELSIGAGGIERAIVFGLSQSGRFLRQYLYDGFNEDEHGRAAADGIMAHVAGAGRGSFNHRFAQPSQSRGQVPYPTDLFPFSDLPQTDPVTGVTDGLLPHAALGDLAPKVFYTNSSAEYWGGMSLLHTTIDGKHDVEPVDGTRVYSFSSGAHVPAPAAALGRAPSPPNVLPYTYSLRALLLAMDRWIEGGTEPPESRFPRIDEGDLITQQAFEFPAVPGIEADRSPARITALDFGPQFADGILTKQPPEIGDEYPVLLPRVDEAGNELGGIRMPGLAAPLGTYTVNRYVPLARTAAERKAANDPRPSVAERYATKAEYLEDYSEAARQLADEGYILAGDVARMTDEAGRLWDWVTAD